MINLICLLVQQGVLKKEQVDVLVRQVEVEVLQVQQVCQVVVFVVVVVVVFGEVCVFYILQVVCDQICDEVKVEVMIQVKVENWVQFNVFLDWVLCISFDGDVCLCYELCFFGNGNSNQIIDFVEFNDDGFYDVNLNISLGLLLLFNICEDCDSLLCLCVCFGFKVVLLESWSVGICIGIGLDNNLVLIIQIFGGGFGKKDFWFDQGYLIWKFSECLSLIGGWIVNLFLFIDLLYFNDFNFDGVVVIFNQLLSCDVLLFGMVGVFFVEYSLDIVLLNGFDKEDSDNKWMYGV